MSNKTEKDQQAKTKVRPSADTDWFARLKVDSLTDATNEEFLDWLQQDPKNEQEYERCELAWELASELEDNPHIAALISRCDERVARHNDPARRRAWSRIIQPLRDRFSARPILSSGALAFTCMAAIFALLLLLPQSYETGVGEQRVVSLPDGSSIMLNTDTKLSVNFSRHRRAIKLSSGEAVFDVAHDPSRPFDVLAANGLARAVGTRFNVALEQNLVTVSVLEGVVEVRADIHAQKFATEETKNLEQPRRSALLQKGQAVNYWEQGTMAEPLPAQIKRIDAWQRGKLEFDANPLVEVIKEHNRYSLKKIVISNDQLESLQVSGIFNAGDTEALLFALQETFGIRALDRNNLILLVPKT